MTNTRIYLIVRFTLKLAHQKNKSIKRCSLFFAIQQDCRTKVRSTSVGQQTPRKLRLPSPYQGAETRRGHQNEQQSQFEPSMSKLRLFFLLYFLTIYDIYVLDIKCRFVLIFETFCSNLQYSNLLCTRFFVEVFIFIWGHIT